MLASLRNMLFVTLLALFVATSVAEIVPETTTVLTTFGETDAVVTVMAVGSETEAIVSESSLYTVGTITSVPAGDGTNYTIPLTFDSGVGTDDITVTVGTESFTGRVVAAGCVIKDDGKIVSGDDGDGVTVGIEGTTSYEVMCVGTDGGSVDVSGATITGMAMSGTYMKQLDSATTSLTSSTFVLGITKFRTSSTGFKCSIVIPAIELDGEVFETVLKVTQSASSAPCVALAGTYSTSSSGEVSVDMYNVASDTVVAISVGSSTGDADMSKSSLTMPDQTIVFDFATAGTATITCDGVEAYSSGDVIIEVSTSAEALAKDFVVTVPEVEGKDQLTARLSITESSPDTLTKVDADAVVAELCRICGVEPGPDSCALEEVSRGSAVCKIAANVVDGEGQEKKLKKAVEDCSFSKNIGKECTYLTYLQSTVKAVSGATTAAATGLATWTIVLIAGLGAFALIVLIMLGLLAVYRRSAEQSESDYSSSGPLGVPDPSDLLYEQSIVRDIYGRGDFPDGGPSPAVAEQREREADLREEFPRPPSSSGVSRGSATDDASSTYSV